ncbi:MAG: 16S rRNA (uracil(1498)-N(3))-methyltransferase [Burkholderiaceae bacterium]|nr:16S rRNA (uracil(1498)-N(3))-methyltransferase [Burkholderiaceae bacterium]
MPARLFVDPPLVAASLLALPERAARHVQVLRLQPGAELTLFDGSGGEWSAQIVAMDRRGVQVRVQEYRARECEAPIAVTLALAMPANERMDALVEKATELGAAAIAPLLTERSVLRLSGERAERRQAHWQAIAVAACEQCGRNRVPQVHAVQPLAAWLGQLPAAAGESRLLLGWRNAQPWPQASAGLGRALILLSGPEGGLTEGEESQARLRGFSLASLGPRILRADTAPLAALAAIALTAR